MTVTDDRYEILGLPSGSLHLRLSTTEEKQLGKALALLQSIKARRAEAYADAGASLPEDWADDDDSNVLSSAIAFLDAFLESGRGYQKGQGPGWAVELPPPRTSNQEGSCGELG